MGRNLFDKILLLVKDIQDLGPYAKGRAIEAFVKAELGLQSEVKHLDIVDLNLIRSLAIDAMTATPLQGQIGGELLAKNSELHRTLCFTEGVVAVLRSKDFLAHEIGYEKDKKHFQLCSHKGAKPQESGGFLCPTCKEEVQPILFEKVKK